MLQRLIATHAFVLEHSEKRVTGERPPRDPLAATTLQKKAEASGHSFTRVPRFFKLLPGSLHCRRCQQLVHKSLYVRSQIRKQSTLGQKTAS